MNRSSLALQRRLTPRGRPAISALGGFGKPTRVWPGENRWAGSGRDGDVRSPLPDGVLPGGFSNTAWVKVALAARMVMREHQRCGSVP